jgi:hypothetical protein
MPRIHTCKEGKEGKSENESRKENTYTDMCERRGRGDL